jgi:hypothetical protein
MTVWFTAILLIVELVGAAVVAGWLVLGGAPWLPDSLKTATYCLIFGGIGGCVYCLRGVYLNAAVHKRWDKSWLIWYFVRPVVSTALGGISYLFVKSGLLLLGASQDPSSSELGIWALAFLAGLNVDKFLAKIEGIGFSVWGVELSRQSKGEEAKKAE